MEAYFLTIVGQKHYYGMKPYKVGRIVKLIKEADNEFDSEAIRVDLPFIGTIGYVANSTYTVYAGTYSAGRVYDKITDYSYARIAFVTHSSAIALVVPAEDAEKEQEINDNDAIVF
ncbi:MAG: HIRAN domain-containing protein [Clostridia bacterium]